MKVKNRNHEPIWYVELCERPGRWKRLFGPYPKPEAVEVMQRQSKTARRTHWRVVQYLYPNTLTAEPSLTLVLPGHTLCSGVR